MTKRKSLLLGSVFTALTMYFLVTGQFAYAGMFLLPVVLFFGIWLFKHKRDQRIIVQARLEWQTAIQSPYANQSIAHEESRRLFVPPPLG